MNLPQGYKQTELGIIPEDWDVKILGDIGTFSKGSGVSRTESNTGNIPCVRYGELYTHHNDYIKMFNSFISSEVAKNAKMIKCGDVLFAASGETKEDIGKSVAFVGNFEAYAGGDIIILSTNALSCDAKYIGYASNSIQVIKQKAAKAQGDAVVHITSDSIKNIKISIPPLSEQKAIAEALSDVDELIAALDKKIAKKRLIKQGAMHRLIGFSETNKLQSILLRNIVNIRKGSMLTSDNFVPGNIPVIAGGKTPAGFHNTANRPEKTITISASGASAGYVALYDKPIFATDCSTIEPNSKYNIEYIYYLLKYYQNDIYTMQTGGAQPHIHPSDLNDLRILYTDNLQEQQAIATILSDMDKEIAELEAQRDKYRLVKSGMMQKLLTGEIRLKKE